MKVLVTGAKGMLGKDLTDILYQEGFDIIPTDIDSLDITNEKDISSFFSRNKFDFVIHTAAYTDVDGAEFNRDLAFSINHKGTENIARYSGDFEIPIIYISTDYVFDGNKNSPYKPDDKTNPINVYGESKLKGEQAIQKYNPWHFIARTSWLYGKNGKNFVNTIIDIAGKKDRLKVVSDQSGCPTWTVELSRGIIKLISENKPYGIHHICGSGNTSWHDFAVKIAELMNLNITIQPSSSTDVIRPARRPKYSVMDNGNICPNWDESLKSYLYRE